jgi:hypothetical protein
MVKQFVLTGLSSPGVLHHLGWDWIGVSRETLIFRLKPNNCYEKLSRDCGISITYKLVRNNVKARMELSHQNSGVWPTNTTTCICTAIQGAKYFFPSWRLALQALVLSCLNSLYAVYLRKPNGNSSPASHFNYVLFQNLFRTLNILTFSFNFNLLKPTGYAMHQQFNIQ